MGSRTILVTRKDARRDQLFYVAGKSAHRDGGEHRLLTTPRVLHPLAGSCPCDDRAMAPDGSDPRRVPRGAAGQAEG